MKATYTSKQMPPAVKFFFARIFPVLFIIVGASVLYFGLGQIELAKQSVDWPTVEGMVQQSTVEYRRDSEGGGAYYAQVLYDYTVQGVTYSGNRIAIGDYGSGTPSYARSIVNEYQVGRTATVYYSPDNPEEALLEPGLQNQAYLTPGIGLAFVIAGGIMAIFIPKAMTRKAYT
jgi:hypothetical protein